MILIAAISARTKLALGAVALGAVAVPAAFAVAQDAPAKPAALTAEQVAKGRQMFNDNSCGGCHTLTDGGGSGSIGPSLDGNKTLDHALVADRIANGSGPMPSFGGQLSEADINLLADYVLQVKK